MPSRFVRLLCLIVLGTGTAWAQDDSTLGESAPAPPAQFLSDIRFSDQAEAAGVLFAGGSYMAASADFDQDGDIDLAFSRHSTVALLRNQGDGSFVDISDTLLVPEGDFHGLSWTDLNRDGWLDLLVLQGGERGTGGNGNLLYLSEAGQSFRSAALPGLLFDPLGRGRNARTWDVNSDQHPDLILSNAQSENSRWVVADGATRFNQDLGQALGYSELIGSDLWIGTLGNQSFGSPSRRYVLAFGNRAAPPQLMSIKPDGSLLNETPFRGLPVDLNYGIADVVVADFDGDGDQDLYYLADVDEFDAVREVDDEIQFQFRLREGNGRARTIRFAASGMVRFKFRGGDALRKQGIQLGVSGEFLRKRSGIKFDDPRLNGKPQLDYEKDAGVFLWSPEPGVLELIALGDLSEMYFFAGTIFVKHGELEVLALEGMPSKVRQPCNLLYLLEGERYVEYGEQFGARDCGPGRDAEILDVDNDGFLDIFIANGHGAFGAADNVLLHNLAGRGFEPILSPEILGPEQGRSGTVIVLDYDNDGDQDLFLAHGAGAPPIKNEGTTQLLRNDSATGNWIKLQLRPIDFASLGMGARVSVTAGQRTLVRQQAPGHSLQPIHIGLGEAQQIEIAVEWPSGRVSRIQSAVNRRVVIEEANDVLPEL